MNKQAPRRRGQGPTTYKPARNDEPAAAPPGQVQSLTKNLSQSHPSLKPWNYHLNQKVNPLADKPKLPTKTLSNSPSPHEQNDKPEWDDHFWKANGLAPTKESRRPNTSEIITSDLFANYPKFKNVGPVGTSATSSESNSQLMPTKSAASLELCSSPSNQWKNYHKWWESFIGNGEEKLEAVSESKTGVRDSNADGDSKKATIGDTMFQHTEGTPNDIKEKLPGGTTEDEFILELADLSELVEFLLYKCSAEEWLHMLPELIQDLDNQFRTLVSKYMEQKEQFGKNDINKADGDDLTKSNTTIVDTKLLNEVSKLHNDLKAKNETIVMKNGLLEEEVENLKSQLTVLRQAISESEETEQKLQDEIKNLKSINNSMNKDSSLQQSLSPITLDAFKLKVENETLKLMNTKLRTELEFNERMIGAMEVNYLCQNLNLGSAEEEGQQQNEAREDRSTTVVVDKKTNSNTSVSSSSKLFVKDSGRKIGPGNNNGKERK